jgi:hypothetical protein
LALIQEDEQEYLEDSMNIDKLTVFFKKMQIRKIAIALLLGTVLLMTTACNNGDQLGARPHNPPVQMGGQNNPHKAGGDGYSQNRLSNDPVVNRGGDRADLMQVSGPLIAGDPIINRSDGLLYPGSSKAESARSKDDFVSPQQQRELLNPGQIPETRQPVFSRSDPDAKLLEKAGQTFEDASEFLTFPIEEEHNRSELEQVNPMRQQ